MSTVSTVSLADLTGDLFTLTATVSDGPPAIVMPGGDHPEHRELRDRVHAALANSGQPNRHHRVEVHLRPTTSAPPQAAAVAVAVLAATAVTPPQRLAHTAVLGDIGLDGSLRPTRGTLPAVQTARAHGIRRVIVPSVALREAALVDEIEVLGANSLTEIGAWLAGDDTALQQPGTPAGPVPAREPAPMRALKTAVLRAVTIAAAGGHHVLLDLDTDTGTALAASWLHALLPDLTPAQQLERAAIQSLIGPRDDGAVLVSTAPVMFTHYGEPLPALLGGHAPGVVTQAHHGVLFAGELDRFSAAGQDALRAVLLDGEVHLAHGGRVHRYPAGLQLFATSISAPRARHRRMSPALHDVIDIRLSIASTVLGTHSQAEDPACVARLLTQVRAQVAAARATAAARWSPGDSGPVGTNATVSCEALQALPEITAFRLRRAVDTGALSPRGRDAVLRLAWTIADLDGAEAPHAGHIDEALALRDATTASAVR